jgi:hypothetical protein
MSYTNMDHAAWVERNNAAYNSMRAKRKGCVAKPEKLSAIQAKAMDILGMVFGGIYNAPIAWDSVEWEYGGAGVSVTLTHPRSLATFDFYELTNLVFLCHEARIRCQIEPGGFRSFRLSFWQRKAEGDMSRRHPSLDEAVAAFRKYLPADHRIIYREPVTP